MSDLLDILKPKEEREKQISPVSKFAELELLTVGNSAGRPKVPVEAQYMPETRNRTAEVTAEGISGKLVSVVRDEMSERFKKVLDRKSNLGKLRAKDVELAIVSFALRMTILEVCTAVNKQRQDDGIDDDLVPEAYKYYRNKYAEIIDEVYATAATRIGEVYSLADKVVRIARYDEIGDLLYKNFIPELRVGIILDSTTKKINAFVKVMEKLNIEMGGKTLEQSIRRPKERDENEGLSKEEIQNALKEKLDKKYEEQLPELVKYAEEVTATDATNS